MTKLSAPERHAAIAARARAKPMTWVHVRKYRTTGTASATASFIRNGKYAAYERGQFEARQSGEGRVNVSVRFRG